jgi:hypothetical protein
MEPNMARTVEVLIDAMIRQAQPVSSRTTLMSERHLSGLAVREPTAASPADGGRGTALNHVN